MVNGRIGNVMNRYPFTYFPSGWYKLFLSTEVKVNIPGYGIACGKKWVVLRKANQLVEIFSIEKNNAYRQWRSCEINGVIFVYFSLEEDVEFTLPIIPEFNDQTKWMRPFALHFSSKTHVQEVAENALDTQHFSRVHAYLDTPLIEAFTIDQHTFRVKLNSNRKVFGRFEPATMDITYHGLGVVHAIAYSKSVDLRVLLMSTPIATEQLTITILIAINKTNNFFRNFFFRCFLPGIIARDFRKDIPIWDNKLYYIHPNLCRGDGEIMKIRQWAKQFYTKAENNLRLQKCAIL